MRARAGLVPHENSLDVLNALAAGSRLKVDGSGTLPTSIISPTDTSPRSSAASPGEWV